MPVTVHGPSSHVFFGIALSLTAIVFILEDYMSFRNGIHFVFLPIHCIFISMAERKIHFSRRLHVEGSGQEGRQMVHIHNDPQRQLDEVIENTYIIDSFLGFWFPVWFFYLKLWLDVNDVYSWWGPFGSVILICLYLAWQGYSLGIGMVRDARQDTFEYLNL